MKKYILKSDYEFLIKIKNQEDFEISPNSQMEILLENDEQILLSIYPIFSFPQSLPYNIKIDNNLINNYNKINKNNYNTLNYVDILELENNILIKFNPFVLNDFNDIYDIQSIKYKNENILILTTNFNNYIFFNKKRHIFANKNDIFKFKIQNNNLIAMGNNNLFVLDLNKNISYFNSFEKLNVNNKNFEMLSSCDDINNHILVNKLNIEDYSKSSIIYLKQSPKQLSNPKQIPFALLQAILIGDVGLAKNYISNTILLSTSQLKEFLGDFDNFEYLDGCYYLIKNNKAYKKLDFVIANNKIIDIVDKDI